MASPGLSEVWRLDERLAKPHRHEVETPLCCRLGEWGADLATLRERSLSDRWEERGRNLLRGARALEAAAGRAVSGARA